MQACMRRYFNQKISVHDSMTSYWKIIDSSMEFDRPGKRSPEKDCW